MQIRTVFLALATVLAAAEVPPRMPIPNNYQDSILTKWLAKPVLASKLLDDAESLETWSLDNVDQAKGQMTLTTERKMSGGQRPSPALRRWSAIRPPRAAITAPRRPGAWLPARIGRRGIGSRSGSMRICPGVRVVSLIVTFHNAGKEPVPDSYGKMGVNYVILKNHEWNHIVWEIANLPRDKVTGLDFSYRMQGHEPGAARHGHIRYRQTRAPEGRMPTTTKGGTSLPARSRSATRAIRPGRPSRPSPAICAPTQFELVDTRTGRAVLSKKVTEVNSQIGRFQVMDFSEVRDPGTYFVRAGGRSTRPFPIGDDVWKSSLWKAINFFYAERCGYPFPACTTCATAIGCSSTATSNWW